MSTNDRPSTCRSCNARIIWATHTGTGNITCLDAEPTPEGRWHISDQLNLNGDLDRIYQHGEPGGHTSHFATCEFAANHRRVTHREPA